MRGSLPVHTSYTCARAARNKGRTGGFILQAPHDAACPGFSDADSRMGAFILHGHAVHMRGMIVRSFRHRGLRQLFETDSSRLLKQDLADRVRGILAALAMAETMEGFIREAPPGWRVHRLSGARRYEWSVSVSGNWRITFEERNGGIERVNLEDYL